MCFLKVFCNFWDLLSSIFGKNVLAFVNRAFCICDLQCCKIRIESELYRLLSKLLCQLAVKQYISIFVECDLQYGLWSG